MNVQVGDVFTARRIFKQSDFDRFAALSRDDNPIHVDPDFAARTRFGRPVAHGMLLYGAICGALSNHFPGANQQEQRLIFSAPTYADEPVTLRLEVLELRPLQRQARVLTKMTDPRGTVTCEGETTLVWRPSTPQEQV